MTLPWENICSRLQDWLFLAYQRVRGVEYGLLVATFVAIMIMGLELGIAAGIVAASLLFAYNYSKVSFPCCLYLPVFANMQPSFMFGSCTVGVSLLLLS